MKRWIFRDLTRQLIQNNEEITGGCDYPTIAWYLQISAFNHLGSGYQYLGIWKTSTQGLNVHLHGHAGIGVCDGAKNHIRVVQFVNFI